jgi:YD repeat-containing protein
MALIARSNARRRIAHRFGFGLILSLSIAVTTAAQTATYRLHREASTTANLFQLQTANPDAALLAIQSANLKSVAAGEYVIKQFDTQSGVPNAAGTIPAGSTITFELWLRKTTTSGTMFPRARLALNSAAGTVLGTATGATALTNTLTKYTFSTTTSANISITAADRFYLWVGVNVTVAPTTNTNAELDIEGVVNGNYDSKITVPLPPPPPAISSVSPGAGPVGTSVTIAGSNFGATQGTSTVTFNGVTGTPTNWSNTSITCPVPSGATTGPVVVTVGTAASNGVNFTVADVGAITGTITRASDSAGLNGALVEALQSGVVKGSGTSSANDSYSITGLLSGTYDVRASASRYITQIQNGVVVSAPNSSTVNFSLVDAGPITNIYDELGRLVGVVDPTGDTVTYRYDAVGNLLSISRNSSAQLSLIEFTPNKGPIGASVTIYGTGFSTIPANNVVKFNGTTATVTASTATQISTTVPAGATTGLITVTNALGTVSSSIPFTVGSDVPIITSFTPNIGTAGTTVNISGSNFDSTVSGNRVAFNGIRSPVTAGTTTSLTTSVPAGARSGHISDTTPAGTGVSNDYFFIPPSPLTAADVETYGLMTIGETKTITIATANKVAMLLFEGTAGQGVSLQMTAVSIGSSFITIYKPDGSVLTSGSASTSGGFIDKQILPADGTYTILIDPSGTSTGNMTLTLYGVTDTTTTITPNGPAVTVTTTIPGQNARLTFTGTAGQRISIKGVQGFGSCWTLALLQPDGSAMTSPFGCGSSIFIDTQTLPVNGTYTVLVDPNGAITGSATVNLYEVVDITGTLNFGGPTVAITTDTPGQNARLTFVGSAGQRASVNATASFGTCWNLGIFNPDGSQLINTFGCGSSIMIEPQSLPVAGTYTVVVDPSGTGIGNASVTLYDVTDVTGPITVNGPSVNVSLTTPGQNARLTFDGTAGQRISANAVSTLTTCWNFGIFKPDGTALANTFGCGSGIFIEPQTLPVTGTYTVVVDPSGAGTGSATVNLYEVTDVTGTITPNGAAVPVSLPTPGQNARLTFDGSTGQRISVGASSTFTTCWTLAILKPDATQLASVFSCGSSIFIDPQTLPAAGTYTVVVDPSGAGTGSATVNAYDVVDVTGPITPNGAAVPVSLTPGQNARLTFDGTTGQRISVGASSTFTSCWTLAILKPDATQLTSVFSCGSSIFIDPQTLPTAGTYTVLVDPSGAGTGSATVNAYDVVDVTGSITIDGSGVSSTITTPGQTARLAFNGTAGQRVSVTSSSSNTTCWTLAILKPDGSQLTSIFSCGSSIFIEPQTLPVSGSYTVLIDPSGTGTGQTTVNLYNVVDVTGTLTLGGPAINVSITVPGQNASYTFSGTTGQQATVRVSGSTMGCVTVALLKPDGSTQVSTFTCSGTFNLATQTLPATGTYTVTVNPNSTGVGNLSLSVTNP